MPLNNVIVISDNMAKLFYISEVKNISIIIADGGTFPTFPAHLQHLQHLHGTLSRFVPRPSFLTGVVGHSHPSVGREGTNRVRWPVSKKPVSTKPILTYVSLPFDVSKRWLI